MLEIWVELFPFFSICVQLLSCTTQHSSDCRTMLQYPIISQYKGNLSNLSSPNQHPLHLPPGPSQWFKAPNSVSEWRQCVSLHFRRGNFLSSYSGSRLAGQHRMYFQGEHDHDDDDEIQCFRTLDQTKPTKENLGKQLWCKRLIKIMHLWIYPFMCYCRFRNIHLSFSFNCFCRLQRIIISGKLLMQEQWKLHKNWACNYVRELLLGSLTAPLTLSSLIFCWSWTK